MARMNTAQALAIATGFALVVGAAACNRTADREARGHQGAAINLVGCLQKSESGLNTYVLTQVNSPARSVGTSGSTEPQPGVVAQEQMREAKHAYRLDGDNDQLDKLVGKQVSVEGTIADSSDLAKRADEMRKDTTKPADLDAGDLAKVDVKTIAAISASCSDKR